MRTKRTTSNALQFIMALTILVTGWSSANTAVRAQGGSVDVAIWTHENGNAAYDTCYALVGYSEIGCDENGDGKVLFEAIPYGTYTVHQTADLGPGRSVEDFTIQVTGPGGNSADWQSFSATIIHTGGTSSEQGSSGQTSDIAIVTTENGQTVTDACYVLVDFSNEGCDENGDGKITFEDIPFGTYTVHQTVNLGSGRSVSDFAIRVTGSSSSDGWERFGATVSTSGSSSGVDSTDPVDIALITRDPQDGHLLTGTCYVLVGYSNEGCDENGDGQVTFAAVPPGTYTVRQTLTPNGYPTINDYDISIENRFGVPLGFIVKQAVEQNAPNTRNVSMVFVDSRSYTKVISSICVQFVGASNVGCDEDLIDGQIDFLDVPAGTYEIKYSNLPDGWQIMGQDMAAQTITIDTSSGEPTVLITYVGVYVPGSASAGSENSGGISGTTGSGSSDSEPIALAGEWGRQHVLLVINADGTGVLDVNSGCCVGVQYVLSVDIDAKPVTATVVSRTFLETDGFQPFDEDYAARPGDVLLFDVAHGMEGDLLVITMPESENNSSYEITVCRPAQHFCAGT